MLTGFLIIGGVALAVLVLWFRHITRDCDDAPA